MAQELDPRRRRLVYRSSYTGTKETDLILRAFADKYIADLTEEQLGEYEHLLTIEDPRIYKWITGLEAPPAEFENSVLKLLQNIRL